MCRGEFVVRLQTLPVPHGPAELSALKRQPSARAFVEHARCRRHDFTLPPSDVEPLVEILRALDGLGFAHLLDYWHTTGHQTQLWTTARNAAQLLALAAVAGLVAIAGVVILLVPARSAGTPPVNLSANRLPDLTMSRPGAARTGRAA